MYQENNGRRSAIKTLISIPIFGAMAYGVYKKAERFSKNNTLGDTFKLNTSSPTVMDVQPNGKQIRIGIIGFGIRGKQLMRAAGFAEPSFLQELIDANKENSEDTRYADFKGQSDLNIVVNGVCDVFDVYGEAAVDAGANIYREGLNGRHGKKPIRYKTYKELLDAKDIDAVIIATPDHWHGTMAYDAIKAGKHVYLEKPMSWTVPETFMLRDAVKESGLVFQLGHQGRQTDSYIRAQEIVEKDMLGHVSLIETCTNRNSPNGAWVYPIIDGANERTIDWEQFYGNEDRIDEYMDYMKKNNLLKYVGPEDRANFNLERFFRWRCWWDYSTGLSGDLLTHEYDAINQIMKLGIPSSATSSGGVYFFKDGRTVPDVLNTTMEFANRDLTFLYSATLSNQNYRGKKFMGHDATMELSNRISVSVDPNSTKYADKIKKGVIKPNEPVLNYSPGQKDVDAITSPTELYFAQRGLVHSYIGGKRYDTTHLHIREWLECIRQGKTPSCNIDSGFEEAISAHMGTRSYLEGRTKYWDADKEEIV
ncbi:MAG: Gfo/Idh/MocA family oxidoreductase [Bacteroidales bacterium]